MTKNNIVIHHSLTPEDTEIASIRNYHVNTKGMKDIAYHILIGKQSGVWRFYHGRPMIMDGGHCPPRNKDSIGICILGDYREKPLPTEAREILFDLCLRYVVSNDMESEAITGHCDWMERTCPGKYIMKEIPLLIQEIGETRPLRIH